MARIRTISPEDATGDLADVYKRVGGGGQVAHILQVQSLSPATLSAHHALYRALMFGPGALTRGQREMIAVVVSQTNGCHY